MHGKLTGFATVVLVSMSLWQTRTVISALLKKIAAISRRWPCPSVLFSYLCPLKSALLCGHDRWRRLVSMGVVSQRENFLMKDQSFSWDQWKYVCVCEMILKLLIGNGNGGVLISNGRSNWGLRTSGWVAFTSAVIEKLLHQKAKIAMAPWAMQVLHP